MRLGVENRGGGVVAVDEPAVDARLAHGRYGLREAAILKGKRPVPGDIGRGEVRERARAREAPVEVDAAAELHGVAPVHADARHARLEREVVLAHLAERGSALAVGKRELLRVDARHDVMLHERLNALHGRLAQDEDGPLYARLAQCQALGNGRHGKLVSARGVHDLGALDGSVTIGIGLDHGHHAHARLEEALERPRVPAQRALVDLDPRPPSVRAPVLDHGDTPPCCRRPRSSPRPDPC